MNKEDYVSLEVAKLLKEKGFDEFTDSFYGDIRGLQKGSNLLYNTINKITNFVDDKLKVKKENCIAAPTLYEAAKWLRNKYDINVAVNAVIPMWFDRRPKNNDTLYMPSITRKNVDGKIEMLMLRNLNDFNYEEVYNNGILEALKLI